MNETFRKNILIFDSDRDVAELIARALEARRDCKCYQAATEEETVDLIKDIPFGMVLVDLGKAMAADFSLLKRIKRIAPETVVIVDAYLHQKEQIQKAMELGAWGHILKPIKVESLRKKIDELYLTPSVTAS
ncbi:MAG: response regulator [Syntrophobacteraceae bacterium]